MLSSFNWLQLLRSCYAICLPNPEALVCQHIVAGRQLEKSQKIAKLPQAPEVLLKAIVTDGRRVRIVMDFSYHVGSIGNHKFAARFAARVTNIRGE
jgi:hypothetical protein